MDAGFELAASDDPVILRALLQYYQGCSRNQAEEILQLRGEIAILNARRAGCECRDEREKAAVGGQVAESWAESR